VDLTDNPASALPENATGTQINWKLWCPSSGKWRVTDWIS